MADHHDLPAVFTISKVHILLVLLLSAPAPFSLWSAAATDSTNLPKLLLMTFDGFGWNFLGKQPASKIPNIDKFIQKGVHVRWVENVFPTVTRPNHMSLVTGLYPDQHGIVQNSFYDPVLKEEMPGPGQLREDDSKWVDVGAEPIWVTNSKAGEGRRSGTIYWPCSDAKIKGRLPDEIRRGEWTVSEQNVTGNQRIDLALDWLMGLGKSGQPVNFAAVYTGDPDDTSHKYGPDSQEVLDSIISRDRIVEHLLSEIERRKLEGKLNVIITADHGQVPVHRDQFINFDTLVDPSLYTPYPDLHGTPMSNIWPKEGDYKHVAAALKGKHRNLHVVTSNDSEDLLKMHYATSRRIAPIVVYGQPGWIIGNNSTFSGERTIAGQHGWDPRYAPYMYPFFIAMGPAFKTGLRNAEPFHILDIYPLMCHILGLKPARNEGFLNKTSHILSSPLTVAQQPAASSGNYTGVGIGILVVILAVVVLIVIIRYVRKTKNVSASYKRTFTKAGSTDDLMEDGMVVISDEEL